MAEFKVNISNNDASSLLSGAWIKIAPFDQLLNGLPEVQKKALNTAGFILKKHVKETFAQKMPAANRPFKVPATSKGGYKITSPDYLIDAVTQSSSDGTHVKVFMGGREPNSPLFIARMYNSGTQDRYQRTLKGRRLKTKKFLSSVSGVQYWDPGITAGEQEAIQAMNNIFYHHTKNILENNNG